MLRNHNLIFSLDVRQSLRLFGVCSRDARHRGKGNRSLATIRGNTPFRPRQMA